MLIGIYVSANRSQFLQKIEMKQHYRWTDIQNNLFRPLDAQINLKILNKNFCSLSLTATISSIAVWLWTDRHSEIRSTVSAINMHNNVFKHFPRSLNYPKQNLMVIFIKSCLFEPNICWYFCAYNYHDFDNSCYS